MMKIRNEENEENKEEVIMPVNAIGVEKETPAPTPIVRGSRVKFIGTKSYSGLDIPQYQNKECKVKEISDDRVVIAEGQNIIAAVNIKDCVKL